MDVEQIGAGWNRIYPQIKSPQKVYSQCTVSAHTRIIKSGGGRIRGHKKKLKCYMFTSVNPALFGVGVK